MHIAVDTLGHLLALVVTPANDQKRDQVRQLAVKVQQATGEKVQQATGEHVEIASVDQGYTGERAAQAADEQGIHLEVVKLPAAKTLCCCRNAGGWSDLLPGPPNSGDWSGIMSA